MFDLPASYALPDPACYAFHPAIPAGCAAEPSGSPPTVALRSTADEYPIWGHLPGGLLSRLPGLQPIWWARLGGAAVPAALVGAALWLASPRRPLATAAILLAVTPMAWGVFAVVNPSAMAIGGAVALWAGLLYASVPPSSAMAWLTACGWAALALPRRDGLIWACIALAIALGRAGRTFAQWWRALGVGPQVVVAGSTLVTAAWGITNHSRVSRLVTLSPLILVAAESARWLWRERVRGRVGRIVMLSAGAVLAALGAAVVLVSRPGGWDASLASRVVGETGNNIIEAIGVLGWLDTSQPAGSLVVVCAALGVLVAASLAAGSGDACWAVCLLVVTVVASWVFELYTGDTTGTYWQGRYSLPLLVGIPMMLALAGVTAASGRRVALVVGASALVVLNVAAWAAARRWGVGTDGSMMPWDWDTSRAPLPPIIVLAALAVLSVALAAVLWPRDTAAAVSAVVSPDGQAGSRRSAPVGGNSR